jgi:phosphate-selective porin
MIRVLAILSVTATMAAAPATAAAGQGQISTLSSQTPAAQAPTSRTVSVGGYLQAELDAGARGDSRFPEGNRIFLRRGRLTVSGRAMPSVEFRIQGDFAGGLGSSSSVRAQLTDGYVEWTASPQAKVRVGQFKSPFGAEFMTSSTSLLTVERSLTTDRLTLNRQIGVQVAGDGLDGRVSYAAGLFNGNGRNVTVNDNDEFLYVVRGTDEQLVQPNDANLEVARSGYWATETSIAVHYEFGLDSTPSTTARDH